MGRGRRGGMGRMWAQKANAGLACTAERITQQGHDQPTIKASHSSSHAPHNLLLEWATPTPRQQCKQ